jgi:ubiquinone/menaquinone biosynthesis C-methylase UbiE
MTLDELLNLVNSGERIAIELGCGPSKKKGYLGVDKLAIPGVDFIADLESGLGFLPDNSVDEIYTSNFLEHIDNFELFMKECHRVIKPGGEIRIIVPHFSNPWFYSDYTHRRFFGLYTFLYFSDHNNKYRRNIPGFYTGFKFQVIQQKLIFKSPPFYFRNLFRQVLQRIFNSSIYMQELYEDVFCYMFACQEIDARLRPVK